MSRADFEAVLSKVTNPGERALYGLCRLAGLRRGEALGLPWSGRSTDKHGVAHSIGVNLKCGRVTGTMGLNVTSNGVPGIWLQETFDHQIPAPGVLPLLGLAGLMGARRRR